MTTPAAILDANVLFPMVLRDTLLRVAAAGCFRVHWSSRILDEMARNLIDQHRVTEAQAGSLLAAMASAFPEASVEGWEPLEEEMRNDPKDRHVVAAAVLAEASCIVTENLKDFYDLPEGVRAVSADAFLVDRIEAMPQQVLKALRKQAAGYRKPPTELAELLDMIEPDVPRFVAIVRGMLQAG